ncbi:hypothetical protein CERSUDRAFT_111715 [Gelatoporia subvermispora B]|uniref:HMG box domain-containing protein n=1 Tax=Ceriporiopsis subvermispora (strain B) TaxID=914234 RepID=M2QVL4_CERS8|nr:hypothetical protein CERSUDRAFT_111715 [Gelatoporia subvermispora B]
MADMTQGVAQLELAKLALLGNLASVAEALRGCAAQMDHFAQLVSHTPLTSNGMMPPANGQYAIPVLPAGATPTGKRKGRGAEDGEGRKRVKKVKDPNAPKRPASSYLLFQNDVRGELKGKFPDMPNNELLNHISELWKKMPPEQKDAYEQRQRMAKDQWMLQKTAYEARGPDGVAPVVAAAPPVVVPAKVAEPAVASPSSSSSSEEQASSEDESSSDEETPPPKKAKKSSSAAPPVPTPKVEKEKKHKKSKA